MGPGIRVAEQVWLSKCGSGVASLGWVPLSRWSCSPCWLAGKPMTASPGS